LKLLIVVTIILIISAIAIPNLMKSKQQANETAAVGALKALTESAVMYSNSYGGFPRSIANLGPSSGALTTSSAAADLIDSGLATGVKSGYKFTFTVITADTAGHVVSYSITAVPVSPGSTGVRSFYTDESGNHSRQRQRHGGFVQPADRLTPHSANWQGRWRKLPHLPPRIRSLKYLFAQSVLTNSSVSRGTPPHTISPHPILASQSNT